MFKKLLNYSISLILIFILGLLLIIWIKSPGTADPIVDQNGNVIEGSISTIEKLEIGGIDQHLIIRGADSTKPVLLFLHGGPGFSELMFLDDADLSFEKEFVFVQWEQRGAGKSFSQNIPDETMSIDQLILDAKEVSEYLIQRFHQKKIYVVGHSWGSLLGTMTVNKYPELFHAYIGIGQIGNKYLGEQISYKWIHDQAKQKKDHTVREALKELPFPDSAATGKEWAIYIEKQRFFVDYFGGGLLYNTDKNDALTYYDVIFDLPEFTIREKINFLKSEFYSGIHLSDDMIRTDLFKEIDSLQVPIHIIQGLHDYQTPYSTAKKYFDHIKAPSKTLYTFEKSAHTPFLDEPEKFNAILKNKIKVVEAVEFLD